MWLLLLLSFAEAAPFPKWGLGVTSQANLYPFAYPLSMPTTSVVESNPKRNLDKSNYVVAIGPKFMGYLSPSYRGSIRPVYTFGSADSGHTGLSVSVEMEKVFSNYNGIEILAGGGLGTGGYRFDQGDDGVLTGRTLFLRAKTSAMMPSRTTAWELGIFAELGIVGEESYTHNDVTYKNGGFFASEDEGSLGWGIYYPVVGVELTGYIGKFTSSSSSGRSRPNRRKRGRRR